MQDSVDYTQV